MAYLSFKSTLEGSGNPRTTGASETATGLSKAAVDAAVGVLLADGASPTEAHVTTLVAAWATLEAQIDLAIANPASGVMVTIDLASVATRTKLHKIFNDVEIAAIGSGQIAG